MLTDRLDLLKLDRGTGSDDAVDIGKGWRGILY